MKKLILGLVCLLAGAVNAFGQSTTVSGTVTDAGSQAWAGGTYRFSFTPNPQFPTGPYTWTGGALTMVITGSLDGSGNYSVSIPSNTAISPQGSTWILQVTPNATSPSFSTPPTTITGGTQTLNVTPPAIAISWSNPPGPAISAYADSEITGTLPPGAEYFNTTTLKTRVWNGSAWADQGGGGGGGSCPAGAATQIQVTNGTACVGDANFTWDTSDGSFNATGTAGFSQIAQGTGGANQIFVSTSAASMFAEAAGSTITIDADQVVAIDSDNGNIALAAPHGLIQFGSTAAAHLTDAGALTVTSCTGCGGSSGTVTSVATQSPVFGGPITTTGTIGIGFPDRSVPGTTDTIVSADRGGRVVYTNTGAVAVTLPQEGSAGFTNSFYYYTANGGVGGVVTITPTTSLINGVATLVLQTGQYCRIGPSSAGTDYAADCSESQISAGSGITLTRSVHGLSIAAATGAGTVTSVSFTGGLISVATPTTTPALTVAGTSGGIPYFSGAATWASSAAGAVNTLMKWGGAGNPPIASSVTDNGTTVSTAEQIVSTLATGTAPFSVASTTNVANLNASSLNGATFAAPGAIGGTTPGSGAFTTLTASGQTTLSGAGAASTPSVLFNGTVFTGGSGTTTFPNVYLNYGTAPTTWLTTGTLLGINAPSGFNASASIIDAHINGGNSIFQVTGAGSISIAGSLTTGASITVPASSGFVFLGRSKFISSADGRLQTIANAGGALTRFTFGAETTSLPAFTMSGTNINTTLGDGSAGGTLTAGNIAAMQDCGTTSTCSATAIATGARIVKGSAPLVTGTPSTVTISGISPAFTSSTSYVCSLADATATATALLKVANVSGSSFTITGQNANTDVINYVCAGN